MLTIFHNNQINNDPNIIQAQGKPIQIIVAISSSIIFTLMGGGAIVSLLSTANRQVEDMMALGCFGGLTAIFGLLILIWGAWNFPRQITFDLQEIVIGYVLRKQVFDATLIKAINCEAVILVSGGMRRPVEQIEIIFKSGASLEFNSDMIHYNHNGKTSFEDLTTRLKQLYNL